MSRHCGQIVVQRCKGDVDLPGVCPGPVVHAEMRRVLTVIGNECLDPEPGSVGRGYIEPRVDVAAGRRWAYIVAAERRAETPARLEVRIVKDALADTAGARVREHVCRRLAT